MIATRTERKSPERIAVVFAILAFVARGAGAQAPAAAANTPKATGMIPITAETTLVIRGIPGQIVVTTKPARELRYGSRVKDKSGSARPVAVTTEGTTVTLTPLPGATMPDGILRVDAPASFTVRVEAQGGSVLVDGFAGAVAIVGNGTAVRAQALTGRLDVNVNGGSLTLAELGGGVVARIGAGATLLASSLRGSLDLNSRDATFKVQGLAGACQLEAHGGSGELAGLGAGGNLRLSESALRLSGGKGVLTVTSDAAVDFANMLGSLQFDMNGGTLHGKGNQGPVVVQARHTDISLEGIVGTVRVEGDGLKAKLVAISGELDVDVTRGNIVVQRALSSVNAVVLGGDAQLLELQGAVHLELQGGNADVSWASMAGDKDSLLQNRSGDIAVRFPTAAACRFTAKASSGRITSDLPSIKVPADATEVQGALGQAQHPLIEIEADGNIHLTTGAKALAAPS